MLDGLPKPGLVRRRAAQHGHHEFPQALDHFAAHLVERLFLLRGDEDPFALREQVPHQVGDGVGLPRSGRTEHHRQRVALHGEGELALRSGRRLGQQQVGMEPVLHLLAVGQRSHLGGVHLDERTHRRGQIARPSQAFEHLEPGSLGSWPNGHHRSEGERRRGARSAGDQRSRGPLPLGARSREFRNERLHRTGDLTDIEDRLRTRELVSESSRPSLCRFVGGRKHVRLDPDLRLVDLHVDPERFGIEADLGGGRSRWAV